ncbi:5-methylcytosine restriction system specificity protein McrC [Bacillus toyonensis]|uniref:5-methylcytosine restriction system specificity protein McrC n=1 Tax=Bacillus toyonensis TaxID=155322 RepID=UPI002ACB1050|nr:hypothetical protein [Bacillus toyonensis]
MYESKHLLINTKWKSKMFGNRLGMKRIDLFQMYAYLTRYDCAQTAILIYPKQFALELDYNTQIES